MFTISWLKGVFLHRPGRLAGLIISIALTVSLLASLGSFLASSASSMTKRAIKEVPVDWQIQLVPGTNVNTVKSVLSRATTYTDLEEVGYADVAGLSATTGGTTQVTGAGKILGISERYISVFPLEIRQLLGSKNGVLLAQQTAANLHVTVGDTVTVERMGLTPVNVKIDGIIDLPNIDSLFQAVGVPPGAAPQAPPDNVILLPSNQWHQIFNAQAVARPDSIRMQLHVRIAHNLSSDPVLAFKEVQQRANNFEARIAGSGVVGDNLAARLDGVREDALYSKILFLFLGSPGAILAIFLTIIIGASGSKKRIQEQSLLRVRGASVQQILRLEISEALIIGLGGIVLAWLLTFLVHWSISPGITFNKYDIVWTAGASLLGLILAIVATIYPAWAETRHNTVMAARAAVGRSGQPLEERLYLDIILLIIAAVIFWRTASTGYQLVLTPEGVASTSVHYEAFIAPLCLWIGGVLFCRRLWNKFLARGRNPLARMLNPLAGNLSDVVAASLSRQRKTISRGMLLVALALSFAVSTAVFNTTYNAQSRVDARLTNGADVTASGPLFTPVANKLDQLKALPGVAAVQPMQHRFAYVGNDLQDIYGIDPLRIGEATDMANAYFANGNAQASLEALNKQPDGVLVSDETVKDFQLSPGDQLNLRLQNAHNHQYQIVTFHFVGIIREFPTAPKDSFLVANASYITQKTGSDAQEIVLIRTQGKPSLVAANAQKVVHSLAGVKVSDLESSQNVISSSLTAVDLRGLTTLELIFAVLMIAGSTGLVLALSWSDRRRVFTILAALGAKNNQLGAFLWSEGLLILLVGGLSGILVGFVIAQTLVKVLTGVFDPPPETLFIPWGYLIPLGIAAIVSTVCVVIGVQHLSQNKISEELRDF